MKFLEPKTENDKVIEVVSDEIIINSEQDVSTPVGKHCLLI